MSRITPNFLTRSISSPKSVFQKRLYSQCFGIGHIVPRKSLKYPRYHLAGSSPSVFVRKYSDFLEEFIATHNPPDESVNYFNSLDWSRKVLENPRYKPIAFYPRHFDEKSGENAFFAQTVNTETTFPHVLALQLNDFKTPEPTSGSTDMAAAPSGKIISNPPDNPEVICLMAVGNGLAANISTVHGGVQCVIFDEVVRLLVMLHHINIREPGPRDSHFTVQMNTRYISPMRTPSNVLVRAWLARWEGRKFFAKAQILSDSGVLLTENESIWVTAKRKVL